MKDKFKEALLLLKKNLWMFTTIILTVWLPGNILTNVIIYNNPDISIVGIIKLPMIIEAIFGPLYVGAMVYALYQIKMDKHVSYNKAIGAGVKNWFNLFTARLIAGLLIFLGLIAFIIPGIVLMVRYSLLDAAVIIENRGVHDSRKRSVELTTGKRWQIFNAAILFHFIFFLFASLIYAPFGFIESSAMMPVEIAIDCILDVIYAVIQIVIFLFYWEAKNELKVAEPPAAADSVPSPQS
jgi:hypothetical protein